MNKYLTKFNKQDQFNGYVGGLGLKRLKFEKHYVRAMEPSKFKNEGGTLKISLEDLKIPESKKAELLKKILKSEG